MRKVLGRAAVMYLLFAVIGRFVEEMGAAQCECDETCWCKRPGLSLFRWVLPVGHRVSAKEGC